MTRDDLVKELEKAERRSAREKSYDSDINFIYAKTTLHIWDTAYAAGVAAEKARCAALCSEVAAGKDAEAIEEAILARGKK